jgi:hypothetical protein
MHSFPEDNYLLNVENNTAAAYKMKTCQYAISIYKATTTNTTFRRLLLLKDEQSNLSKYDVKPLVSVQGMDHCLSVVVPTERVGCLTRHRRRHRCQTRHLPPIIPVSQTVGVPVDPFHNSTVHGGTGRRCSTPTDSVQPLDAVQGGVGTWNGSGILSNKWKASRLACLLAEADGFVSDTANRGGRMDLPTSGRRSTEGMRTAELGCGLWDSRILLCRVATIFFTEKRRTISPGDKTKPQIRGSPCHNVRLSTMISPCRHRSPNDQSPCTLRATPAQDLKQALTLKFESLGSGSTPAGS